VRGVQRAHENLTEQRDTPVYTVLAWGAAISIISYRGRGRVVENGEYVCARVRVCGHGDRARDTCANLDGTNCDFRVQSPSFPRKKKGWGRSYG
jgi:hypothetical protein